MVIRWQPAYRPLNSFSTIDREFDRLSRQLAWALRNADHRIIVKILAS
jgi:hypothetical protein